jgi:hypothetical protein
VKEDKAEEFDVHYLSGHPIMKTSIKTLLLAFLVTVSGCATSSHSRWSAHMTHDEISSELGIPLEGDDRLNTPGTFRPPVEITVVAKTDSTDLRLGYAADQIIFNWELDREQLRVDGGPADGLHKPGAGSIPTEKYVTVRWLVTPKHQAIYVDDELRFEHAGDYSKVNKCVSVFPAAGSKVTVKSIKVKQITDASR